MDIVESCESIIKSKLEEIQERLGGGQELDESTPQTQTLPESSIIEKDKNLDRIIDQQVNFKLLIEKDDRIRLLKKRIRDDRDFISEIRKVCSKIGQDGLRGRQELLDFQAKEREKYQMQQLRSIAEDYRRHQTILELRKKELEGLKLEVSNEDDRRQAYLDDVEKNLEKQLQARRKHYQSGDLMAAAFGRNDTSNTSELYNPKHLELTSVDEFAPYGTAPHSRRTQNTRRGGGSGRGRKRKQPTEE